MYLKRVEINGFKSFANKTEIILDSKITGVVGPNGSGKSNISDAIRWVLGEQSSKNLRGSKMEDVIFNGTATRSRKAYAEVSLVFDNSDGKIHIDYSEIIITRKMYRSGESEYYINHEQVRLRDIVDLMRDTGIGKANTNAAAQSVFADEFAQIGRGDGGSHGNAVDFSDSESGDGRDHVFGDTDVADGGKVFLFSHSFICRKDALRLLLLYTGNY